MKEIVSKPDELRTDTDSIKVSYRRLVTARLPMNLYSARAQMQRRAATLLHGLDKGSGSWEEFDCLHLADDERGDRTSLLLGGASGGVALTNFSQAGLITAAGTGTLVLLNLEKLSHRGQSVLCSIIQSGRYTPVGDPFPRPVVCRLIVGTERPLAELARRLVVGWNLVEALGHISFKAEDVVNVLGRKEIFNTHPNSLAAAS
jgi:transcriptional regulator of acetoin/glycerol metabolism